MHFHSKEVLYLTNRNNLLYHNKEVSILTQIAIIDMPTKCLMKILTEHLTFFYHHSLQHKAVHYVALTLQIKGATLVRLMLKLAANTTLTHVVILNQIYFLIFYQYLHVCFIVVSCVCQCFIDCHNWNDFVCLYTIYIYIYMYAFRGKE